MAFQIPTLAECVERARSAFRAELPGSDAWLWPNNIYVTAKVIGGKIFGVYLFADYIQRQAFAHLADQPWLEAHGRDYGIARIAASYAEGRVTFAGTPGALVPAGIIVERGDGVAYQTTGAVTVSPTGQAEMPVRAQLSGKAGNALPRTSVSLVTAFAALDSAGAVGPDGIGGGADEESDESLRQRILHRKRYPPHGGAAHDYVAWAREVAGVTRVFVEPLIQGPGSVGVYFLMDDLYEDGIPLEGDVERVQAVLDSYRPVTATVIAAAPVPAPVSVTVSGLSPATLAVQESVKAELADFFRRTAGVGTDANPFTLWRSRVSEAISQATGETHHVLVEPSEDLQFDGGQLPVLGGVTFL